MRFTVRASGRYLRDTFHSEFTIRRSAHTSGFLISDNTETRARLWDGRAIFYRFYGPYNAVYTSRGGNIFSAGSMYSQIPPVTLVSLSLFRGFKPKFSLFPRIKASRGSNFTARERGQLSNAAI